MKINLYLAFDHELPLGNLKTSYSEALFEPTQKIINLAHKIDVPIILFTDVFSAIKYRDWDYNNYFIPYITQIKEVLYGGHDVQLHVHPHWLTTTFSDGMFIPSSDFALADFHNKIGFSIDRIISESVAFLKEILSEINPDYHPVAFRAGGLNIEPESAEIFKALIANGIKYDSSIGYKYYYASGLTVVDFRELPNVANWYIDETGNFRKQAKHGIIEIPIATKPKSLFEIPTRFKLNKYAFRAPLSHGSMIHEGKRPGLKHKLKMYLSSRYLSFDNYTQDSDYLISILDYNVKKFRNQEEISLAACSHPKTMGSYALQMMEEFVVKARKKYPDLRFMKFNEINY